MLFFFFNDTATTEIYTLSLHDALPIFSRQKNGTGTEHLRDTVWFTSRRLGASPIFSLAQVEKLDGPVPAARRSEEHTSELQSQPNLVCRLLLEKKKNKLYPIHTVHTVP